jgi:glycosyltransferase involved in cell wall biosynthesis
VGNRRNSDGRRLRILHVIDGLGIGGAQSALLGMVQLTDEAKFESFVGIAGSWYDEHLVEKIRTEAEEFYVFGARGLWDLRGVARIVRAIRRHEIDIVHTHLVLADVHGGLAARLTRRPVVSILQNVAGDRRNHPRLRRLLGKFATRWLAHSLIAVSDDVKQTHVEALGIPPERLRVIRNVPVAPLLLPADFDRDAKRAALAIPDDAPVISSVARLVRQKDHMTLLRALPRVLEEFPNAVVLIAGDGDLRPELTELARQLHLDHAVRFLGVRDDAAEIVAASDVFCNLTREFEGLPVAVADAMSLGVPVVATRTPGLEEVLVDRKSGILVPSHDPEAVARRTLELLRSPEARLRLAGEAQRRASTLLDHARWIAEIEDVYLSLGEDAGRAGVHRS